MSEMSSASGSVPNKKPQGGLGLLKRSRSMGTFDGIVGRENLAYGQQAVQDISNKVKFANPPKPQTDKVYPSAAPVPVPVSLLAQSKPPQKSSDGFDDEFSDDDSTFSHLETVPDGNQFQSTNKSASAPAIAPEPEAEEEQQQPVSPKQAPNLANDCMDDLKVLQKPVSRVDYFSHDWKAEDIAGSWRYVTSRRQEVANSARLENASWRTWAKAMYNLQTVSPETVNWLKDYDVTWLYGPLYHDQKSDESPLTSPGASSANLSQDRGRGSQQASKRYARPGPVIDKTSVSTSGLKHSKSRACHDEQADTIKSILKKKTIAEIMLADTPGYTQHLAQESKSDHIYLRHHNYRHNLASDGKRKIASLLNQQYSRDNSRVDLAGRAAATSAHTQKQSSAGNSAAASTQTSPGLGPSERHVHFNVRVEQCIALDPADAEAESSGAAGSAPKNEHSPSHSAFSFANDDSDDDEDDEDDDEDDEDGGLFLGIKRSVSGQNMHAASHSNTIASLPATTLKPPQEDAEQEEEADELIVDRGGSYTSLRGSSRNASIGSRQQVQPARQPAGIMANYDYGSVFPSGEAYKIVDPAVKAVAVPQSVACQSVGDLNNRNTANSQPAATQDSQQQSPAPHKSPVSTSES